MLDWGCFWGNNVIVLNYPGYALQFELGRTQNSVTETNTYCQWGRPHTITFGIWNIYGNFKGSYSFAGLVRAERKMRSREEIGKVTKQQSCAQCTLQSGYKKIRPKEELREARNGRFDRRGKRLLELRKCFITCSQNWRGNSSRRKRTNEHTYTLWRGKLK